MTEQEDMLEAAVAMGLKIQMTTDEVVDQVEAVIQQNPVEIPVEHLHTPGIYVRTVSMPAGTFVTSKIHRTEHPFIVSKGKARVWTRESGVIEIQAPFVGVTKAGTRRILHIIEDCVWSTMHANPDNETVDQIEARIIEPHINPLLN